MCVCVCVRWLVALRSLWPLTNREHSNLQNDQLQHNSIQLGYNALCSALCSSPPVFVITFASFLCSVADNNCSVASGRTNRTAMHLQTHTKAIDQLTTYVYFGNQHSQSNLGHISCEPLGSDRSHMPPMCGHSK